MGNQTNEEVIQAIAKDIAQLKDDYPQLAEFSVGKNCDSKRLVVAYGYRTHRSKIRGGWRAGVPNPDEDGVWFHIDFHDKDSTAQIHTQPVVEPLWFREKKVMFLILEGEKTKKISDKLREILTRHGVTSEKK